MQPLVALADVMATLEWTLDAGEERTAQGALDTLSDDARFYGSSTWQSEATAPRQVHNLVLRAARRHLRNPDAYTTSRAGDETLSWGDRGGDDAGEAHFTEREIKQLKALAGRSGLTSSPLTAWGPVRRRGQAHAVPVAGYEGEKAFPYFADGTEPY